MGPEDSRDSTDRIWVLPVGGEAEDERQSRGSGKHGLRPTLLTPFVSLHSSLAAALSTEQRRN